MIKTQDLNVREIRPLSSPLAVREQYPIDEAISRTVSQSRETVKNILLRKDSRLLVIVGPCSIHDPKGAMEYAARLKKLADEVGDQFFIVMRVYFEKPRTRLGWKGLVNDPHLNDTCDVETGLKVARDLLIEINRAGLPAATEFLDPFVPQYIADLVTWAAIGARTTESQTHREMASGLSMPIGFKNGTDGSLEGAIDAMRSSMHAHHFLGIDANGTVAIVKAAGNLWGHLVLRGGKHGTNYDTKSIDEAAAALKKADLSPVLMVDCSHANSGKLPARQELVWNSLMELRAERGNDALLGVMLESYIHEGTQPFPQPIEKLKPGVSITDACVSWETTERLLKSGAELLRNSTAGDARKNRATAVTAA